EEAVALLLEEKIKFLQVAEIIEEALEYFKEEKSKEVTLENVIELDKKVREYIRARWN
ncbi:MAG: 1-deoxy-D-xylulose-5-phosphate reductoisomerase, partial [Clostridium sp.]|nr:1-deoxy-D-xylulose-5-phosphate reductoisomerase [Clostridium sp.]